MQNNFIFSNQKHRRAAKPSVHDTLNMINSENLSLLEVEPWLNSSEALAGVEAESGKAALVQRGASPRENTDFTALCSCYCQAPVNHFKYLDFRGRSCFKRTLVPLTSDLHAQNYPSESVK